LPAPDATATGLAGAGPSAPLHARNASLARRLAAALYELLLLVALTFITGFALLPLVTPGHAGDVNTLVVPPLASQVMLFCIQVAVGALYLCWFWTHGRRTLPQKTWRMRLVTRAGHALERKDALLRYFCAWISPLLAIGGYALLQPHGWGRAAAIIAIGNFAWAFIDRERAFLHDRLAGTVLVAT
jgi:uncharacterized RDD family membrane protein YckC